MAQTPPGDFGPIFTPLNVENPFQNIPANQYGPTTSPLGKGTVIAFNYPESLAIRKNIIHDIYPLVIITDIWGKYIRGVNLHYLTFPVIRELLKPNCDNNMFSYSNIKFNKFLVDSFRTYVRRGIKRAKKLDCTVLLQVLSGIRAFGPGEKEAMENYIREIIQRQVNPRPTPGFSYESGVIGGVGAQTPAAPAPTPPTEIG